MADAALPGQYCSSALHCNSGCLILCAVKISQVLRGALNRAEHFEAEGNPALIEAETITHTATVLLMSQHWTQHHTRCQHHDVADQFGLFVVVCVLFHMAAGFRQFQPY